MTEKQTAHLQDPEEEMEEGGAASVIVYNLPFFLVSRGLDSGSIRQDSSFVDQVVFDHFLTYPSYCPGPLCDCCFHI